MSKTVIRSTFPQVYRLINNRTGNPYYLVSARSKKWGMDERRAFGDKENALNHAREIEKQIKDNGAQPQIDKTLSSMANKYSKLVDRLSNWSKTPEQAVDHYIEHLGQLVINSTIPNVNELVDKWKSHLLLDTTLSKASINDIKVHSRYIKSKFGYYQPTDIRKNEVERVLKLKLGTNNTRNTYTKWIKRFFNWVLHEDKGYLLTNPADGIKFKSEKFDKEFYPTETIKKFFNALMTDQPQMVGYYALLTFAGLRPSEGARVRWEHYNATTKQLKVVKGKTDTRHIELKPVLIEWLEWCKKHNDKGAPLVPFANMNRLEKSCRELMPSDWINDGLRHGFATHLNSTVKDFANVAHYMGNSIAKVKSNYAHIIPESECKEFWELNPEVAAKE